MTTETQTDEKPLISAKFTVRIRIDGCPASGLEALAWRRERGLPDRLDNHNDVTIERAISEDECAQLLAAGARLSCSADGSAVVDFSALGQSCPLTRTAYGHCAQITVTNGDSDFDLAVRALTACQAEIAAGARAAQDRAAADAEAKRRRGEEESASLRAVLSRILAGEGNLDTRYTVTIDGKTYNRDQAGPEVAAQIDAEKTRREQIVIEERDAWILAHGSTRLQKGLATGMIDHLSGAYLDERIAHDLGEEWENWRTTAEPKSNDRLNPEESELDALTAARAKWPTANARLVSVGGHDDERDMDCEWRPALMVDCPWDLGETAIRYLD